jgi:hypothetical protein
VQRVARNDWSARPARPQHDREMKLSDDKPAVSYRVYFLDSVNRISGVEEVDCATDEEARRLARDLGYTGAMEIWSGARLVARAERGGDLVPAQSS